MTTVPVTDEVAFWVPVEFADQGLDYAEYADLALAAGEAGLFNDQRELDALGQWVPEESFSGHVEVARTEDGIPLIRYGYKMLPEALTGFLGDVLSDLHHFSQQVGFVDVSGLLVQQSMRLDPEDEFYFTVSGWVKTTEETYLAAVTVQQALLARLEQDGSEAALLHLSDKAEFPKVI